MFVTFLLISCRIQGKNKTAKYKEFKLNQTLIGLYLTAN